MRILRATSIKDVFKIIDNSFKPLDSIEINLVEAGCRVLSRDIVAEEDIPAFDRSTIDGYAVRACETVGSQENSPALLKLSGMVRMGYESSPLPKGECIYVPTGGMLPMGADAVVVQECTEMAGALVQIFQQVAPGENTIKHGEDLRRGQIALKKGHRLRGQDLIMCASLGVTKVSVTRLPRIGIISTGDELAPPEATSLEPGKVRDCNSIGLTFSSEQMGGEVLWGGIISDRNEELYQNVSEILRKSDMVVISGGSSADRRNFTLQVLKELGEVLVEGISVQPGKPTLLAKCSGKPVIGLPGHPVSSYIIYALLGKALIRKLTGEIDEGWQPVIKARLTKNIPSRPGRVDLIRVSLAKKVDGFEATPIFGRSGLVHTLVEADGITTVPEEANGLSSGEEVEVYLLT